MTYRQVDADTFVDDQTKETFRLAGANAMEKRTAEGANLAADTSIGARVNEATPERLGRDHYGRTVARFLNPDGSDLNQQLINEGKMGAVDYTGAGQLYTQPQAPTRAEPTQAQYNLMGRQAPDKALAEYQTPVKAPTLWEKAGRGVRRGTDTAQAGYFGTVSAVGNLIARDPDGAGPKTDTLAEDPKTLSLRDRFSNWMQRTGERGYMRNMQQAEQNPKTMTLQQATESGKLADYSSFAFEAMGEAIPSFIEMLGVGAATALTGGAAGAGLGAMATRGALGAGAKAVLERSAQRALVNTTRKKLIAQGVTPVQAQALSQGVVANLPKHLAQVSARRGFTAGLFGSSAGMQAGQFYKEAENETGVRAPGTALLAGGAAGVPDVVGFEVFLSQLLNKRIPINKALDILKPVMAGVAVGVPGEGLTEAAQEVIGVLNTEYHRKSDIPLQERMLSKENLWRYAEAGAAGAVFGGAFGGAGGAARGTYDFATRERSPVEAPTATPPTQETPPVEPGTPPATGTPLDQPSGEVLTDQPSNELVPDAPAEPEGLPDFDSTANPDALPDFDSGANPDALPDFDSTANPEGLPDLTPPAEPEGTPDFDVDPEGLPDLTPPATPEGLPDLTPPATPEGLPDFDASAGQNTGQNLGQNLDPPTEQAPGQDVNLNQDTGQDQGQKPAPAPPAAKPYALDDRATPDQQRGFLFDSEEAAAQTAKDLLGPLDIPVTPRQQHEVSIAEDDSVIPGSGAFGLATPIKSNDELTVDASEGVAQDVETVPARFLADMDQARTTLGGTPQLKAALTRASPSGWAKDEVVPKVLDTFETLSRALAYADDHSLKSGEYLIGRKNDGYAVVDLRAYLKAQPGPTETGIPTSEQNQGVSVSPEAAKPAPAPAPQPEVAVPKTQARLFEKDRWAVEDVRNDPESVYVFGDNVVGKGNAGQAVVRGLPNAMGIPTKYAPSMGANAFFRDVGGNIAPAAKQAIDKAIAAIKATGKPVVFSKGGLGTGLAKLQEAPATLAYLNRAVKEAFGIDWVQPATPAPSVAPSHDAGLSPLATEQAKFTADPQNPQYAAAFQQLLQAAFSRIKNPVLFQYVKRYAVKPMGNRALWTSSSQTLSLGTDFFEAYIKDPAGRLAYTLHALFHELGHALDQVGASKWQSSSSEGWGINPALVSFVNGKYVFKDPDKWAGIYAKEIFELRNKALTVDEDHPLRAVHDLARYGFHELKDLAGSTDFIIRMRVIREVFAQAHGIYWVNPAILQQEAPQTFKFFEDLYAKKLGTDSTSRTLSQRVREAFRAKLPEQRPERGRPRPETGSRTQEGSTRPGPGPDTGRGHPQQLKGEPASPGARSEAVGRGVSSAAKPLTFEQAKTELKAFSDKLDAKYPLDRHSKPISLRINEQGNPEEKAEHARLGQQVKDAYERTHGGGVRTPPAVKATAPEVPKTPSDSKRSEAKPTAKPTLQNVIDAFLQRGEYEIVEGKVYGSDMPSFYNTLSAFIDQSSMAEVMALAERFKTELSKYKFQIDWKLANFREKDSAWFQEPKRVLFIEAQKPGFKLGTLIAEIQKRHGRAVQEAAEAELKYQAWRKNPEEGFEESGHEAYTRVLGPYRELFNYDKKQGNALFQELLALTAEPKTPFDSKRSAPTQGTTPEAFRQELSAKERKRLDAPNVHVLHRTTDAPFPVAPDTAGLYLPDGSVYFFTENIAPGEAFGKTVHELGAHYGLPRMVGKEVYDGILNQLQDMVKAKAGTFTSTKAAYARAKEAGASDEALWHETLAYLAEASPRHGLIRRLVHAIKRFLRSLGVPVGRLTEQDLVSLVQVAAFKEGLKGEGLSTGRLASKRLPATPYVAQYGVKTLKNGKVAPAYGILYGDGRVLDTFDKKAEAEAALKADREGYAQEAARRVRDRPAERLAGMKASERGPQAVETRVYGSPEGRRTPDYNPKTNAGPTAVDDTPGFSTAKPLLVETPEWKGVRTLKLPSGLPPVTSLPQAEQAQRQAQAARAKADAQTTTQQRLTADLSPASPLSPKAEPALDVKPLTGKLGKLAAMMRGAKDRTRAISTSLALMLRSERKAPGVNVGALLELYRNALDTGRTEQAEPEEVAERQDATRKRLQKQRRAVALVTELRDAAQVVAAEEDQLAERIKDFNAAKQRATKDPAFIKELQQSAQEAEQRVNAAKARVEALKTEEAALLNALKKPVARSVRNLTKRQQAAVAGLAQDYPDLTDRLRAVTAWVSPTDLPLIDHLAKAIEAIDDYRHRDTSTLYDLDDVLMAEADDHLAARQVEARVQGEPGEGWQEQSMNVEAPTEGFYTLFKGQYFTQALAEVLSPLLKSTQRTEGELRQRWDQVTEALEGVGPIENTLFGLIEAANTMVPAQGTTLDAATRVVEMKLSDAEAWLNEDPDTTFGTLLLREVQTEDAKLANDAQYAQRNKHSNVGRFTQAMVGLRAWHDRYQVPYGQLYLQYDAKSQQFSITERMTSTNPNALEVFVDPHTGIATSLLEWVNDYLAQAAKNWKLPGKTGKETEFFRDNVLTLTPIDHITGKFTGKAQKADPLLKTDSQTGFIYVQGKSITQLGYALAQQQGLMTPENDYQAFMLARAALLDHANLALNTPELMDKNIARSAKEKLTFAQALAQEQGAREGRLPKQKDVSDKRLVSQVYAPAYDKAYKAARARKLSVAVAHELAQRSAERAVALANETVGEPNTLGVVPAPSVVEGEAAFKKSLNAMDLAKQEVFDPVYQKVYDAQIAKGKTEALAKKIATGRANEALRKHLLEQKDKERASDAWEYEGQWDLDSGTAPLDVAEKKQLAAAEEDAEKNQRLSKVEERIGATSTKATGEPQNLPVQAGGVFGQEGTEAHGLIQRALDALGFTKTRIHLYTSDQVEAYEAALKARNMTVWQGFTTRRERVKSIPAAVAFIQGEIFLYYDKNLTGEALREALSHELGHVVFRVMLNSERERNTPLWNRLFNEYQEADTGQRFMEWFADEAGRWINQRDHRVTNATQGFIKRIVDALKAMFRALGLRPAKGAVAAYMDGLALREKEQAYAEFQRALTGRIGQGYDLTTMQMAYHSRASERIHMRTGELDFITMDGVKQGTLAQAQRLLDAVPALQTAWAGAQTVGQWVTDTLSTANNFLREQNLAELTMHADVLDRGARQRVVEFTTNEQIDELLHDPEWSKLLGGVAEAKVQGLKDRANALRKKDWVAGVVLIKYKDRRTGVLEAEIRPIPQESFNAAIQRLYQGQWGSSDEGYRKLLHGKTEAEISEIGKELLRNDPKSETAKALAAWLKTFYKDYVVKGFTGAHSGTVHIGQQEDWGLARYYSPKAVEANLQAFIDLLTTTRKDEQGEVTWRGMQDGEAREFASHIITGQEAITEKDLDEAAGLVRPTLSPGAPSKQGRHITLPIEELLPFLETNADAVIARYTHSMIKRVEWEKRFGDEVQRGKHWVWQSDLYGQLTQQALINNHRDTLSANRMKYLLEKTRAINEAYLGRYGAYTTDPRVRTWMSWTQAVMNVLVMPLSLLSQFPDLVGPLTRMGGGTGAYAKGLRDAYRAMRDKDSDLWKVAEMYGIVYRDFRDSQAASFFDSQYLTTGPQKLNDWLFKWNGMQMFTNFSRLLSFHASGYWLEDLITGQHPDAERWLKDLGLTPSEVQQWVEGGKKEYTSADGEKSVAFKIMLARQRFVQESVFSPNAGQRPLFASHPYAMLVWHLKQFAFSFFTQILKPAAREVMKNPRLYGKMMAVLPLALMMPLAMLGMGLRDELKYGEWAPWRGERPSFDQDPEGWLSATGRVISRTGVLGPLQLLIDADRQQSWGRSFTFAMAGPAASKVEELMLADDTGEFVMKALPGLSMLPAERAAFRSWVE